MGTLARMNVIVGMNATQFHRRIEKVRRKVKRVGRSLTDMGQKLTIGVSLPMIGVATMASRMAISVEESENRFTKSFGAMAEKAREWSEKTGKALKLNRFALRDNASIMNVMLKSMGLTADEAFKMSTSIVELAADMGSFYDLPHKEAFEKLQAGLTGEGEALKRLGILVDAETVKHYALKTGIISVGEQMTAAEMVQARYAAIIGQTTDAQGDLADTAGSTANMIRAFRERSEELMTSIGQGLVPVIRSTLLPTFERLMTFVEQLVVKFNALPAGTQSVIIGLAALAAAAGPVLIALGGIAAVVAALPAVVGGLATALGAVAGPVGVAMLLLAAAIGAGVVLVVKHWETVKAGAFQLVDAVKPAFIAIGTFAAEQFEKVRIWALDVWPTVQAIVERTVRAISVFWDEHGATIMATIRQVWGFAQRYIGNILDVILGTVKTALEVINGNWTGAWDTIKNTVKSVWDGIGSYVKAGVYGYLAAMNMMIAEGGRIIQKWLVQLRTWSEVWMSMPWVGPVASALMKKSLKGLDVAIGSVGDQVMASQDRMNNWLSKAGAALAPIAKAAETATMVESAWVTVPAAAGEAMRGAISIIDPETKKIKTTLAGGFGKGIGEGLAEGQKKYQDFRSWVEANPIKATIDFGGAFGEELDRALAEREMNGEGPGVAP